MQLLAKSQNSVIKLQFHTNNRIFNSFTYIANHFRFSLVKSEQDFVIRISCLYLCGNKIDNNYDDNSGGSLSISST